MEEKPSVWMELFGVLVIGLTCLLLAILNGG